MGNSSLCGPNPAFRGGPVAPAWTFPKFGLGPLGQSVPLWFWLLGDGFMTASVVMSGWFIDEFQNECDLGGVFQPAPGITCEARYAERIMEQIFRASIWILIRYFGFTNFLVFPFNQLLRGRILPNGIGSTVWTRYTWGHFRNLVNLWINCREGGPPGDCLARRWEALSVLMGFMATLISLAAVLTTIAGTFSSRKRLQKALNVDKLYQPYPNTSWGWTFADLIFFIGGLVLHVLWISERHNNCISVGRNFVLSSGGTQEKCDWDAAIQSIDQALHSIFFFGYMYLIRVRSDPTSRLANISFAAYLVLISSVWAVFNHAGTTPFGRLGGITVLDAGNWIGCEEGLGRCEELTYKSVGTILRIIAGWFLADRVVRAGTLAAARLYVDFFGIVEDDDAESGAIVAQAGSTAPLLQKPSPVMPQAPVELGTFDLSSIYGSP